MLASRLDMASKHIGRRCVARLTELRATESTSKITLWRERRYSLANLQSRVVALAPAWRDCWQHRGLAAEPRGRVPPDRPAHHGERRV